MEEISQKIIYKENLLAFEVMKVERSCSIKDFIQNNNLQGYIMKIDNIEGEFSIVNNSEVKEKKLRQGEYIYIKKQTKNIHTVKPAQTLKSIAQMYGVDIEHIKKVNNIKRIFIGQQLFI